MNKPPMEDYWNCQECTEAAGGIFPEDHVCTVTYGECPVCGVSSTLIPWVDFDWPKDKANDKKAKLNRD